MRSSLLPIALSTLLVPVPSGCRAIGGLGDPAFDSCVAGADCNAAPPAGWSGPVAFYEGPWGQPPPCPGDYPVLERQGNRGPHTGPTACSACTCGAPSEACTSGGLTAYVKTTCNGQSTDVPLTPDQCSTLTAAQSASSAFRQATAPAGTASCLPDGGVADAPALSWSTTGAACAPSTPTPVCASGSLCALPPPAPYAPRWCIWHDGAATCPSAFPVAHVWDDPQDTRGCTPCQCNTIAGTCTVTTLLYSDVGCQTQVATVQGGQCTSTSGIQSALTMVSYSGQQSCAPSGGDPTGGIAPQAAVTVCCP
jgi:hypothetical protein